jgi:preprotein translocase subunit YajC
MRSKEESGLNPRLGSSQTPALLQLGCAIAVIVGAFGPWLSGSVVFGSLTNHGSDNPDGKLVLAIGVAAAFVAIAELMGVTHPLLPAISFIIFCFAVIAGIVDFRDIQDRVNSAPAGVVASIGWGIYVVLIGGIVGAIVSLVRIPKTIQWARSSLQIQPAPTISATIERSNGDDRDLTIICYVLVGFILFTALGAVLANI